MREVLLLTSVTIGAGIGLREADADGDGGEEERGEPLVRKERVRCETKRD